MKLYLKYFLIHLKSQRQYKISFLQTLIGQFLTTFGVFLGVYFMMAHVSQVEGFTFNEINLCFSVVLAAFSIAECFARGFDTFSAMIGNGEFDRIMLRPRNVVFQVLASKIDFTRTGKLVQAAVMLAYSIPRCGINWNFYKVITLIFMIVGGTVIFSGLFVVYAALCFFTTEGLEFMNIFTDGGKEFGRYPFSVYGEGILKFFTYGIPLALFQYYPLLFLLGRSTNKFYMILPLLGCFFLLPCYLLWRIGIRRYQSTGS